MRDKSGIAQRLDALDARVAGWNARHGVAALRISLGVVFLWFGLLKVFPGVSPAEDLAGQTIQALTGGLVIPSVGVPVLGVWESLIGLGLISGKALRITLILLFVQMAGTITPLFLFPGDVFVRAPFVPTLVGQYIIKNVVLVSAAIVVGATVRGGKLRAETTSEFFMRLKDAGDRVIDESAG
ncbi:MAG: DoxX family protein [Gemmatimonadota bacterium]